MKIRPPQNECAVCAAARKAAHPANIAPDEGAPIPPRNEGDRDVLRRAAEAAQCRARLPSSDRAVTVSATAGGVTVSTTVYACNRHTPAELSPALEEAVVLCRLALPSTGPA